MNYLLEVKQPGCKLTPDERRFFDGWRGQVDVIYSVEDALKIIDSDYPK